VGVIVVSRWSPADGELSVFDLSFTKLLVLAVIALVVFGPNELPKLAAQAGRALRDLRRIAEGAKNDLKEGLGPEFQDFDFEDLNPRRFVQKHLLDEDATAAAPQTRMVPAAAAGGVAVNGASVNGADVNTVDVDGAATGASTVADAATGTSAPTGASVLAADEHPPFDMEAT
jgi:sec-independent protein translocase protein TatB